MLATNKKKTVEATMVKRGRLEQSLITPKIGDETRVMKRVIIAISAETVTGSEMCIISFK